MKSSLLLLITVLTAAIKAQGPLPYREIPDYPPGYSAGSVAARLIDGLGFRFYWATEGLRPEDLAWRPGPETRTSEQTIDHIYEMSNSIANATRGRVNSRSNEQLTFAEKRERTLRNLKTASDILKQSDVLDTMKIVFQSEKGRTEYPFWNHLNGPIADCLWHVGQIVSFRRSSGNPLSEKVSVFTGKIRD